MEGTIKVKNITFEKGVNVRLSIDEWESHEDIPASYVPGLGLGYADPCDTSTFRIVITEALILFGQTLLWIH